MKLYNSLGPNPRMVRMFLEEKGLELPVEEVDLAAGENRRAPYTDKNPAGQCPVLELDSGAFIAEVTVVCEYLEELHPEPALIGSTPEERAETRMWTRRCDLLICEPMANGFRFAEGLPIFQDRVLCRPEAADGLKAMAQDRLGWLDGLMNGKEYIAGSRFSLADIHLYCFLDFGASVGQAISDDHRNLQSWFGRVAERPSADASRHPAAAALGVAG